MTVWTWVQRNSVLESASLSRQKRSVFGDSLVRGTNERPRMDNWSQIWGNSRKKADHILRDAASCTRVSWLNWAAKLMHTLKGPFIVYAS